MESIHIWITYKDLVLLFYLKHKNYIGKNTEINLVGHLIFKQIVNLLCVIDLNRNV